MCKTESVVLINRTYSPLCKPNSGSVMSPSRIRRYVSQFPVPAKSPDASLAWAPPEVRDAGEGEGEEQ